MNIINLIFPKCCIGCDVKLKSGEKVLCPSCNSKFNAECASSCPVCKKPHGLCSCPLDSDREPSMPKIGAAGTITIELSAVAPVSRIYYHLSVYTKEKCTVTDKLILSAKTGHNKTRSRFIASHFKALLMQNEVLPSNLSEIVITNVPRRRSAIIEYGCDQAQDLAVAVAKALNVQYIYALDHVGKAEQKELSQSARIRNARSSNKLRIGAQKHLSGKTVVLIDDIVTTGSSISVCADLCTYAGAQRVICISVGRRYKNDD